MSRNNSRDRNATVANRPHDRADNLRCTDDTSALTDNPNTTSSSPSGDCFQRIRNGWRQCFNSGSMFFVEPVLVLFFLGEFPVDIICQKYILDWYTTHLKRSGMNETFFSIGSSFISESCFGVNVSSNITDFIEFENRVQSAASWFGVYESLVWGAPAVISSIILCSGGDRFGRRFAVIPPLIGSLAFSTNAFLVIRFKAPITWFFVGDCLYGSLGSFAAMIASCFSIVADRTAPERRMVRIFQVEMCMLVSGMIAPFGLGWVIDKIGHAYSLLIIISLSVINLVYVFLCLPNAENRPQSEPEVDVSDSASSEDEVCDANVTSRSIACQTDLTTQSDLQYAPYPSEADLSAADASHQPDAARASSEASSNNAPSNAPGSTTSNLFDGIRSVVKLFSTAGPRRWKLIALIGAFLVSGISKFNSSVQQLFLMNEPLCWTINQIGMFTGISLGVSGVGAVLATMLMKRWLDFSDCSIAVIAGLGATAACIYKFFVRNSLMMYITSPLAMFGILLIPSIRSAMSARASRDEQGAVFGTIASVEVICAVLGTVVFNSIYSRTLYIASGFVFIVKAAFYAVGCIMNTAVLLGIRREEHSYRILTDSDVQQDPRGS